MKQRMRQGDILLATPCLTCFRHNQKINWSIGFTKKVDLGGLKK